MNQAPLHILIVDDAPEDRLIICRLLARIAPGTYTFTEVDQGAAAIAVCQAAPPDCVLLDYRLPDHDGLSILAALRSFTAVPVVLFTGVGNEALAVEALQRGAQDYLVKGTLTGERLHVTIQRALVNFRLARERDQSLALLRTTLDTLPVGVAVLDAELRICQANTSLASLLGQPVSVLHGQCLNTLRPDLQSLASLCRQVLTTGEPIASQEVILADPATAPERRVWQVSIHTLLLPDQDAPGLCLVLQDVTAQYQARAALQSAQHAAQEAHARLEALISSAPNGIGYLDCALRYQLVNPTLATLNGRTPAEHVGNTVADMLPGLAPRVEPLLRQVLATGVAVQDWELQGGLCPKDGIPHTWLISYFPVRMPTNAVAGVGISVTDITQSKRTAAALSTTERKLGILFEILPIGISILDAEHRLAYANPALAQILQLSQADLYQGVYQARHYVRPDGTPMPAEEYASTQAFYERQATTNVEKGIVNESGEVIWVSVSAVPVDLPDWRVVIVTTDITARKQSEAQLYAALAAEQAARLAAEAAHRRTTRLQAATADLANALTPEAVIRVTLEHGRAATGADIAIVALLDADGSRLELVGGSGFKTGIAEDWQPIPLSLRVPLTAVVRDQAPVWLCSRDDAAIRFPDFSAVMVQLGTHAGAILPLCTADRVLGGISFGYQTASPFNPEDRALLTILARQCAQALERAQLHAEVLAAQARLRTLSERLIAVQEEERRHLARELHDEIGQSLTGLSLILSTGPSLPPDMLHTQLAEARRQVAGLIAQVRQRALDLRPALLDDLGLHPTLTWFLARYSEQSGITLAVQLQGIERRFPPLVELTAYRIVQEALTNVARHAGVMHAQVAVWVTSDELLINITDAGRGFDVAVIWSAHHSSGLTGMHERAVLLGGTLTIQAEPGAGTSLLAILPIAPHQALKEQ